jgi:hypothetical protein
VVSLWFLIKPFITTSLLADKLQKDINQFKKDENIFNTLLQQQKTVTPLNEQYKIIFGNPKANFEITFVSNRRYCNLYDETLNRGIVVLDTSNNVYPPYHDLPLY